MSTDPSRRKLRPLGATHRSLREQIAQDLRDRIADGELTPGTHLVERVLAEELQVSRVPVRDALNILKGEGVLTEVPRKGVFVTEISRKDVDEIFELREILEVHSVRLIAERATDEELAAVEADLRSAAAALESGDLVTAYRYNQAFHDAITGMMHNDLLASMLEPLQGRLHWLLRQNDDPALLYTEHLEIFEAMARHDSAAAAEAALKHVLTSRRVCLELLAAGDQATD